MTKEELEKEAEEKYIEVDREFIACQDEGEVFNIGYVLGAEPREKRIAELEAQIEKMKCCYNCKHSRTEYEHCRTDKHEKWELKEND